MLRPHFHFCPTLDVEKLRAVTAERFAVEPDRVFIYYDAVELWGSDEREPDATQLAAYEKSAVALLIRRYEPDSGPIEGWLSVDRHGPPDFENAELARLFSATGSTFFYPDPVPDPDDEPGDAAAQIEVTPDGRERLVWLSEYDDAGQTRTDISGRGADEENNEDE